MRLRPAAIGLAALFAAACTSTGGGSAECDRAIEPLLTAVPADGAAASPFPSDLFTRPAETPTGLQNDVHHQDVLFEALVNHQDGWAPHGPIRIIFSGGVNAASLPRTVTESTRPEAAIQLVDTVTLLRAPFRLVPGNEADRVYLIPFKPLLEERRYAIVVRKTVQPALAACTARSAVYAAVLAGRPPAGLAPHAAAALRDVYAVLADGAAALGFPAASIALAVPYTTESITRDLIVKRELVTAAPITAFTITSYPALETDGSFNHTLEARFPSLPADLKFGVDAKLDNVARIVLGNFKSADYRNECHLAWGYYVWMPEVQCESTLEFLLTLPKLSAIRPEYRARVLATGSFPVIVFGHGLTACKETLLAVVNTFAEYGFAVAGIDVVEHGTRNFNAATGLPNDPLDSCGETIREGLRIMRAAQPELARDNFRQTALDEIQFVHMLASNPTLNYLAADTGDTYGKLQVETFGYIGQSLGGMIGTAFATVEPRLTTAVLNVPGGGIADFIVAADEDATAPTDVELLPEGLFLEALAAVQVVIGPADPLYYAPYAVAATPPARKAQAHKHFLLQQGTNDDVMPAYLTENLARAMGAVLVTPVQHPAEGLPAVKPPYRGAGEVTVALQQYEIKLRAENDPRKDWSGHYFLSMANDPRVVQAAQHQAARFLWTGLFEKKAEVIDGFTLVP
jgi:pimeloyl-ACP methyl ester carboxylesterase